MTELMQGYLSLTHLMLLSVQGLLQDELQKNLCPYYLKGVCRLIMVDDRKFFRFV